MDLSGQNLIVERDLTFTVNVKFRGIRRKEPLRVIKAIMKVIIFENISESVAKCSSGPDQSQPVLLNVEGPVFCFL